MRIEKSSSAMLRSITVIQPKEKDVLFGLGNGKGSRAARHCGALAHRRIPRHLVDHGHVGEMLIVECLLVSPCKSGDLSTYDILLVEGGHKGRV